VDVSVIASVRRTISVTITSNGRSETAFIAAVKIRAIG